MGQITRMVFSYLKLLRPHQWLKNLLLLFPPFFGGKITDPGVLMQVLPALAAFSCASSCGYIINDIRDLEADRNHKTKMDREIASARISSTSAILVAAVLYLIAMILSLLLHGEKWRFQLFVTIYLLNSLVYTFFFKNVVIMDVFLISFGFLIRVLAGGEVFKIPISNWLFLTVFSVSLMLATGKRLGELISLGNDAQYKFPMAATDPIHREFFCTSCIPAAGPRTPALSAPLCDALRQPCQPRTLSGGASSTECTY